MDPRAPLSVDLAAELLLCEPDTVREKCRSGELAGIKMGRDWVLPAGAFFARLDQLALDQAAQRRAPAKPAAQLHQLPAGQQRGQRGRSQPPTLPSLGA